MVASVIESSNTCTWPTPNLDYLNIGPEIRDISYREEMVVTREPLVNCLVSWKQMKELYDGSTLVISSMRKEPKEGWDVHRSGYKQSI